MPLRHHGAPGPSKRATEADLKALFHCSRTITAKTWATTEPQRMDNRLSGEGAPAPLGLCRDCHRRYFSASSRSPERCGCDGFTAPRLSGFSRATERGWGGMFSYGRGLPQGVGSEDNEERGIRNLRGRLRLSRPATVSVGCCSHRPWTGAL